LTGDWANVLILDALDVDDDSVRITSKFAVLKRFLTKNAITEKKDKDIFLFVVSSTIERTYLVAKVSIFPTFVEQIYVNIR
jgi:hypothetical protein